MLLSSSSYFVFLLALFFIYWPLSRRRAAALGALLFANYFFYAKWDLFYLCLIPAASTCDFAIGLGLERARGPRVRRALVGASVVINLGMLASFKYAPWVLENYAHLSGRPAPAWDWVFPLGISFYAFQSLTYTIDVYRRDAKATSSYLAYLAAVSFFPTTLAGPITRVASLLAQLEKRALPASADGGRALFLIGLGLMKKLLIADYLADNFVNRVFDFPKLYTAAEVLTGVYGYALQLYFDFSGYTDIAIGSALLLGVKLPVNFNMPYAAESIPDFWRRWHITLSNWLRDYLYFSLPGLRSPWKIFAYTNLILTMLLGGLWHGASWNFVVWGLLHGVALAATRAWQQWKSNPLARFLTRPVRIFLTLHFVCFAWVFFRAPTIEAALTLLGRIASLTVSFANISTPLAIVMGAAALGHYLPKKWFDRAEGLYSAAPFYAQAALLALLVIAIEYTAATGAAPFIYTKF
jgi:D-alanyl-lipoteichoic acid acyltransferase DltB (MBOAT superfamily)